MSEEQIKKLQPGDQFIAEMDLKPPLEKISASWKIIQDIDEKIFDDNGIVADPAAMDKTLSAFYQGDRYNLALNELAKRFVYLALIYVYRLPANAMGKLMEVLQDIRMIVTGYLHLVDIIIDDPEEAKKLEETIKTFQLMHAQKALKAGISGSGDLDGNKSKKLS